MFGKCVPSSMSTENTRTPPVLSFLIRVLHCLACSHCSKRHKCKNSYWQGWSGAWTTHDKHDYSATTAVQAAMTGGIYKAIFMDKYASDTSSPKLECSRNIAQLRQVFFFCLPVNLFLLGLICKNGHTNKHKHSRMLRWILLCDETSDMMPHWCDEHPINALENYASWYRCLANADKMHATAVVTTTFVGLANGATLKGVSYKVIDWEYRPQNLIPSAFNKQETECTMSPSPEKNSSGHNRQAIKADHPSALPESAFPMMPAGHSLKANTYPQSPNKHNVMAP